MIRRILGLVMFVLGLLTLAVGIVGAIYSGQVIDTVGAGLDETLTLTQDSLKTVADTLRLTQTSVSDIGTAVGTLEVMTSNLSATLSDTQPIIEDVSNIVAETAPQSIESVQNAIPNAAEAAGVIDNTLRTLSEFGFARQIPIPFAQPLELDFDLGIEYDPEARLDTSLLALSDSLEGLPDQLRSLEPDLATANQNLGLLSTDVSQLSGDLGLIKANIDAVDPLLDDYLALLDRVGVSLNEAQIQLAAQLRTIKLVVLVAFLVLGITQLAPLVLGWDMLTGRYGDALARCEPEPPDREETAVATPPPPAPEPEPVPESDPSATVIESDAGESQAKEA